MRRFNITVNGKTYDVAVEEADGSAPVAAAPAAPADNGVRDALLSMGFTTAEIDLALKGAPEGAGESTLLQHALKRLSFL